MQIRCGELPQVSLQVRAVVSVHLLYNFALNLECRDLRLTFSFIIRNFHATTWRVRANVPAVSARHRLPTKRLVRRARPL